MTHAQVIVCWVALPLICIGEVFITFLPKRWIPCPKAPPIISGRHPLAIVLPWKPAAMFCLALIGGAAFVFVLAYLEPQGVDPFMLAAPNVQRMIIEPEDYASLTSSDVELSEKEMRTICRTLQTAAPISPNHPGTMWHCKLAIFTDDGQSVTVDVSDSGGPPNGVLVYWWSPNLRLNLGTHRCDALGPVIKSIVESRKKAEQGAAGNSRPAEQLTGL